nr:DnaJ homolog subfamily C member 17 [Ipomoea batatas]GMD01525.1 DnaJ homolog subfamily C member 17 [Ipomoea batatas]
MDSDHYAVLGLLSGEEGARLSDKEIAKAYRVKALEIHPDKRPNDPNAKIYFQKLKASYEILRDGKARKEYDDLLRARHDRTTKRKCMNDGKREKMISSRRRRRSPLSTASKLVAGCLLRASAASLAHRWTLDKLQARRRLLAPPLDSLTVGPDSKLVAGCLLGCLTRSPTNEFPGTFECRLIAKYRPTIMPVLSIVIPRLKTNQLKWCFRLSVVHLSGPCNVIGDVSYEELRVAAYDDAKRGLNLQLIVRCALPSCFFLYFMMPVADKE